MQVILNSLDDTYKFAAKLVPLLKTGDVIALNGDLGAGKTELTRALIRNINGIDTEVTSPTFNIVQLYDSLEFTIWHFDLYRLKSAAELVEIGIDEALANGVSIIEWPDIAMDMLPEEILIINLSCGKNGERIVRIDGHGKWKNLVQV